MRHTIRVKSGAHLDILAALDWYQDEAPYQTGRFLDRLDEAFEIVRDNPLAFPVAHGRARRCFVRGFPYQIWYLIDSDRAEISVVALIHQRQDRSVFSRRVL